MRDAIQAPTLENNTKSKFLITITCVLIVMLELMDITIANVILPNIQAALNVNKSTVIWVIVAYTTSSVLMTPLTGLLAKNYSRRQLIFIGTLCFCVCSFLCGVTKHIETLITLRFIQGLSAGLMIPLAEGALLSVYSTSERMKALSFFGAGVMLGPIIGPFLAGYINEWFNWRWVFFINLPFGVVALILSYYCIEHTPIKKTKIDFLALIFLSISIISFEVMLTKGNHYGWFHSEYIIILTALSLLTTLAFFIKTHTSKNPIINFKIFKNRNFNVACLILLVFSIALIGFICLLPLLWNSIYNYPTILIGSVFLMIGTGSIIVLPALKLTIAWIDLRLFLIIGIILSALGQWLFSQLTLTAAASNMILPLLIEGMGLGSIVLPTFYLAFAKLAQNEIDNASGLFNMSRMLGFSLGATIVISALNTFKQIAWKNLSLHINPFSTATQEFLQKHASSLNETKALGLLHITLEKHALFAGFMYTFSMLSIITASLIIIIPFIHKDFKCSP